MNALGSSMVRAWLAAGALTAAIAAHAQTIPSVPTPSSPAPSASAPAAAASLPQATASAPAPAPTTYVVPSVAVLATHSSNVRLGTGGPARSDALLQVVPRVFLQSSHANWRLQGNLSANANYYVGGEQPNAVSPLGNATLHTQWVPNLFFVDADMSAVQQSISPYQGQGGPVQGSSYTSTQWRVSPYIERLIDPGLRLLARSDDTWTQTGNAPDGSGVSGGRYLDQHVLLQQAPRRLGYELDLRQIYTTYDNEPYAWLRDSTLRAAGSIALAPRLVLALIGGRESVRAYSARQDVSLYGARLQWHPTRIGGVDATVEHRFFGTGWQLQAVGGGPRSRLSLSWSRDASSSLAPLGSGVTAGDNLQGLLNSLLAGQIPDPLQRARLVQQILGSAGLPAGLQTSGGYYMTSSVLRNDLALTGMILRVRDTFALTLYRNRVADLFLPGQDVLRVLQTVSNDNLQTGFAFNYGHRLTPLDNLNITLQQESDTGFGFNQGQSARQRALIAQLDHRLSSRTIVLAGLRRRLLSSTRVVGGTESAVFAGLVHRF